MTYAAKIRDHMGDGQKFDILYTLLGGGPEKFYDLLCCKPDKMEVLCLILEARKLQYEYRDRNLITEMQ